MNNIAIIGLGGIGSYLLPCLERTWFTNRFHTITVFDGDTLEKKNLNRQLFNEAHVGLKKVHAYEAVYGEHPKRFMVAEYFTGIDQFAKLPDWIISCVDNNATRVRLIKIAESKKIPIIIATNEMLDSSAAIWHPALPEMLPLLTRFPDWKIDHGDGPSAAGCTGDEAVVESGGQLPLANFTAATHAMRLLQAWRLHTPADWLPTGFFSNAYKTTTTTTITENTLC